MTEEINFYSTSKEYGWLSNFYPARIIIADKDYKTVEHFYQSQKTFTTYYDTLIRDAPTSAQAKREGRSLRKEVMREDWEQVKVQVMLTGLRAKFSQNADLREKLLATGNAVLHENSPTDMFWGKKGQDMLGKLLMQVRTEFRTGIDFSSSTWTVNGDLTGYDETLGGRYP